MDIYQFIEALKHLLVFQQKKRR